MLARHLDPRVVPLEVWDLVVDGVPLYRRGRGPAFGAALGRAAEALAAGVARNEAGERYPDACRQIRRVVLVGGAAGELEWSGALPAERAPAGEHAAEEGGRAILGGLRGLVVDLGQSRLKVAAGGRRWALERDLDAIPISRRPIDLTGRAALVDFVAGALRTAATSERPEAIVLALPCEVSERGVLGTCSYPWRAGDDIAREFLAAAGLADVPTLLLNDAELAAIGVAARGPVDGATLVLTIGWGVGGALLRGAP